MRPRRRASIAVTALTIAAVLALPGSASAEELNDTFVGTTTPTARASLGISPNFHSEADIVWQNTAFGPFYHAFYRRVFDPNGQLAIYRRLNSAPSGTGWGSEEPVIIGRNATNGGHVALGCMAYAPSVVRAPDGVFHIIYEADPLKANGAGCGDPYQSTGRQYLVMALSRDGGHTWTDFRKVLQVPPGTSGSNVGEPHISIHGAQTFVSWHYNPPGGAGPGNPLQRKLQVFNTNNPATIGSVSNSATTLSFRWEGASANNGQSISTSNGSYKLDGGVGRMDVIGPVGGLYYAVLEGFAGVPLCDHPGLQGTTMNIARASSPTGPWYVRAGRLDSDGLVRYTNAQGVTVGRCDQDMPHWYKNETTQQWRIIFADLAGTSTDRISYRELVG